MTCSIFRAGEEEGLKPNPDYLEALTDAIAAVTYKETEKRTDQSLNLTELAKGALVFTAKAFGSKLGEQLAEALLKPMSLTTGINEEVARERKVEPQVQEAVNCVNVIIGDVQSKAKKPLLVVVDGLDKIQRLEQAKLIFLESRALRGPLCRLIYTVPMLLFNQPEFKRNAQDCKTLFLPNVRLFERLDASVKDEDGYATMHEVISKRLALLNLKVEDVFEEDAVEALTLASGGVMRFLVSYTLNAFLTAERLGLDKANRDAVQQALENQKADLTAAFNVQYREELRNVREQQMPSNSPIGAELLNGLYVLAYRNGQTWFYPHPLLWDSL